MALVYAVVQQKGGAGKTTLVANLAAAWADTCRVAVIDVDPQRSLSRWHRLRSARDPAPAPVTLAEVAGWRLSAEIDRHRRAYDVVLVDTPAQLDLGGRLAVRGADLVLVPVQPSVADLWATEGTAEVAAAERRSLLVILNRVGSSPKLRDLVATELAAQKRALAAAMLGNRTAFAASFAVGLGVSEAVPRSLASREIMALRDEISGHGGAK